ncbi:MAG: clostripain-related cysteine peptidase [Nitrospira sp.]
MPNTRKKWTIMVYLAGDNNLDVNGVQDLKEMKKVGTTADINVIAQFDRAGAGLQTTRYCLRKGTSTEADAVESIGETNTGSPEALIDFITWGVSRYPADHYVLVLWNHGQGWDDTDIYAGERGAGARRGRPGRVRHALFRNSVAKAARLAARSGKTARAILLDDDAKDFLDNLEMKQVVAAANRAIGHKLDILGMDACLMSMAEVAYQMRESVEYTVGSEETEPLDGWPYDTILQALSATPDTAPSALCKLIVKHYLASYRGSGEAVTQSAIDLSHATAFAGACKALASALKAGLKNGATRAAIVDARNRVQEYDVPDNVDLLDLCRLLKTAAVPAAVKSACDRVVNAVEGSPGLVVASGYSGTPMKGSHGVAIYFPTRSVSPLYANLDFTKKTRWGTFLKQYLASTRGR